MTEFEILRSAYLFLRNGLAASTDESGIMTLEAVLWMAGLAVLAIATVAVITTRVNQAVSNIPTGPVGP